MQALTAGEIDYTTLLTSSIRAAVAGLPVRVIMGLILKQTFFLLSQPEIRDVRQLKGKRIAVANFGSATDKSARMALDRAGLDSNKDAIVMALGDTGLRYAALQARTVEAAVLSPPYNFSAQRQGFNNLVWLGDLLGENPSNGLTTTVKKLKEQPDQIYRMLRATVRSMIYTREHTREVLPLIVKEFRGWDNETIGEAFDFIVKGMSRDGTFSESVLRDAIIEEKSRLNVKKKFPSAPWRIWNHSIAWCANQQIIRITRASVVEPNFPIEHDDDERSTEDIGGTGGPRGRCFARDRYAKRFLPSRGRLRKRGRDLSMTTEMAPRLEEFVASCRRVGLAVVFVVRFTTRWNGFALVGTAPRERRRRQCLPPGMLGNGVLPRAPAVRRRHSHYQTPLQRLFRNGPGSDSSQSRNPFAAHLGCGNERLCRIDVERWLYARLSHHSSGGLRWSDEPRAS